MDPEIAEVVPLYGDRNANKVQEDCWRGFWRIVGEEAYRIWREERRANFLPSQEDDQAA